MTCIIVRFKNLKGLVKEAMARSSDQPEQIRETESRKRAPVDSHQSNGDAPNGHESVDSAKSSEVVQAKRPKHDSSESSLTTVVSNGSSA
ncbi:unnamed protein product [Echinostoma caproni]|uniref:Ovule protein n=1 Tax=Echinostoma caproni TaxID=27848 RepID=A0A183A4T4_9TREM|nr:unnamed protein product [Echinostoma caproni]